MNDIKGRIEELGIRKQDVASAVSLDDVGTAVSRAIEHADRRADNLIKSIPGVVDHGLFIDICGIIMMGTDDGVQTFRKG